MFGFRGTMEKLRKDAKRFLDDSRIIETLEASIKQKIMYTEAISHVQTQGHVEDEGTLMKFEDAIPQPLAHTIHGKQRYSGVLGHILTFTAQFHLRRLSSLKKIRRDE